MKPTGNISPEGDIDLFHIFIYLTLFGMAKEKKKAAKPAASLYRFTARSIYSGVAP